MSGVYATIEKKPNGTYALNYVLVRRFNARLHQSLNYLLRAPERTRAAKCLNVLKDAIRDCVYIGEAEVCFSNDRGFPFAFGDTRREYLVWSLDGKSIFCVPDSLLLEEAGEEYEDSGTRTFKTRETAEDFVFTHYYVRGEVSLLWDLDANTFTWFTGEGYSIRAYNFKTGRYESCRRVTYSFEQMANPMIEKVGTGESRRDKESKIIPLSEVRSLTPAKGEVYACISDPENAINYTAQRRDDGPAVTVTGSVFAISTPRGKQDFQGLTYIATLDRRFGFDTWVYKLMQDGKQVWRGSYTPEIEGYGGNEALEGLYATVSEYDPLFITKDMTKGLPYRDPLTVFIEKLYSSYGGDHPNVANFVDVLKQVKARRIDAPSVAEFVRRLLSTYRAIESSRTQKDRERYANSRFGAVKLHGNIELIVSGTRNSEALIRNAVAACTYQDVAAIPVCKHARNGKMRDLVFPTEKLEILLYTKEGYSQSTIALLLGIPVKQVAEFQQAMANR